MAAHPVLKRSPSPPATASPIRVMRATKATRETSRTSPSSSTPSDRPPVRLLDHVRLNPPLQLRQIQRCVLTGPGGKGHGEAEHRNFSGDVMETTDHVALTGHRDHRAWLALPNDPPRQLAPGGHEDRHPILACDPQDAIESHLGQAPGDKQQQL